MGLNGAKICQNRAAENSGTSTTLTGTGTGYPLSVGTGLSGTGTDCPLHPGTGTTQPVSVPPTVFAQKNAGFCIFTHFSSTTLL